MKKISFGLLPRVICAIILGIGLGYVAPSFVVRLFATLNWVFAQLLEFIIPLIIIGLVVPGIADMGKKAGSMLLITLLIAYLSTLISGFFTYFSCSAIFPALLGDAVNTGVINPHESLLEPFFKIRVDPLLSVMTALVLSFMLGVGIAATDSKVMRGMFLELKEIIGKIIYNVILPVLPVYIFGIFLNMTYSGAVVEIISLFGKVIGVILLLHVVLLVVQFSIAGAVVHKNPFKMLWKMLPAYATALGTSSSAATIPITLECTKKLEVREDVAGFTVPLCATIHLSGSVMKITAMALAICMLYGIPYDGMLFTGFIFLLSIMMVAAPGVPGGAIMASIGVLQSVLGFDQSAIALIIALYIAIDGFGTACNVTGDGAIAVMVNKIAE